MNVRRRRSPKQASHLHDSIRQCLRNLLRRQGQHLERIECLKIFVFTSLEPASDSLPLMTMGNLVTLLIQGIV